MAYGTDISKQQHSRILKHSIEHDWVENGRQGARK